MVYKREGNADRQGNAASLPVSFKKQRDEGAPEEPPKEAAGRKEKGGINEET